MKRHGSKGTNSRSKDFVAEIQGLYGPFSFSEILLQKIWLQRDFDGSGARTIDGQRLCVVHPGRWNRLGGPDFKDTRLVFADGVERVGDVELHLHAEDWAAHGHAGNRAYDGVILHVVLFPPAPGRKTFGVDGREIAVLALLPLLHHDLEEYAAEEAVERLADRPSSRATEILGALPAEELTRVLRTHAERRWAQKIHFARLRIQRLGWEAACHHTALEILGYRFNRAPMLRVAGRWPLTAWADGGLDVEEVFASEAGAWSVQGVRPANHPRTRLRQYAAWAKSRPDWPARLAEFDARVPAVDAAAPAGVMRRVHRFTKLRRGVGALICGGGITGTRFDNLVCDGFLPLLAAHTACEGFGLWWHWFPGDLPPFVPGNLRGLGIFSGRVHPACHGPAQGLLGWLVDFAKAGWTGEGAGLDKI